MPAFGGEQCAPGRHLEAARGYAIVMNLAKTFAASGAFKTYHSRYDHFYQ
jgi:hypothetical protein